MKLIGNIVVFIAILVILFLAATVVLPRFDYNLIVIKSGSMEPALKAGGITIIKKQSSYEEKDIVTFIKGNREIVTHRITEVSEKDGEVVYKTKGDANNAEDTFLVEKNRVAGKTLFSLPYFGYVIGFLRTKLGIIILILIPAGYLIGREGWKIKKELKKRKMSLRNNK